jgi:FkbM family methyltransferase
MKDIDVATKLAKSRYGDILYFKEDLYLGKSLEVYGEWAQNELNFMRKYLIREGDTVIDAGSFIGTHVLAFSSIVGDTGFVYGFEPNPYSFIVLEKNIKKNNIHNAKVINIGLGARNEVLNVMDVDFEAALSLGSLKLFKEHDGNNPYVNVQVETLDSLNISRCNFMKIDVEGMEVKVLEGAEKLIKSHSPIIYAECNSAQDGWPIVEFLRGYGYEIYLHSDLSFNEDNYFKNSVNIFNKSRELAVVGVPQDRAIDFKNNKEFVSVAVPIYSLDDLVMCLIKKPQYKSEVLMFTSGASFWGNDFWLNEVELESLSPESIALIRKQYAESITVIRKQYAEISLLSNENLKLQVKKSEVEKRLSEELETVSNALNSNRMELQEIKLSSSWRFTSPLRKFKNFICFF